MACVFQEGVIVNDRWGKGCYCKHGGYFNCADRFSPGQVPNHKWEKCQDLDAFQSWGYRRNMKLTDVMDLPSVIKVRGHSRSSPTADVCPVILRWTILWFCVILTHSVLRTSWVWWQWAVTTCWTSGQIQMAWLSRCLRSGWGKLVSGWGLMGRPSMLPRPGGSRKTTPLSLSGEIEILFASFFFSFHFLPFTWEPGKGGSKLSKLAKMSSIPSNILRFCDIK